MLFNVLFFKVQMTDRVRAEIVTQILEAASGYEDDENEEDDNLTKLMYGVSLGNTQLEEYLTLLVEDNLLRYDPKMHTYKTTKKGRIFLRAYSHIDKMLRNHHI
jgi:predicted transcriptional regulator